MVFKLVKSEKHHGMRLPDLDAISIELIEEKYQKLKDYITELEKKARNDTGNFIFYSIREHKKGLEEMECVMIYCGYKFEQQKSAK